MREIQNSEFAMILLGSGIVGHSCQSWFVKTAKRTCFFINCNSRIPSVARKSNPLESTDVVPMNSSIVRTFKVCAFPEILLSIVQRIVVYMVALLTYTATQEKLVHKDSGIFGPSSVKIANIFGPYCKPVPFRQSFKVLGIDNGILALRQWDQTVRLVKRLNNCVSFHAEFHWSTSNGLVKFSRYFIPI